MELIDILPTYSMKQSYDSARKASIPSLMYKWSRPIPVNPAVEPGQI